MEPAPEWLEITYSRQVYFELFNEFIKLLKTMQNHQDNYLDGFALFFLLPNKHSEGGQY